MAWRHPENPQADFFAPQNVPVDYFLPAAAATDFQYPLNYTATTADNHANTTNRPGRLFYNSPDSEGRTVRFQGTLNASRGGIVGVALPFDREDLRRYLYYYRCSLTLVSKNTAPHLILGHTQIPSSPGLINAVTQIALDQYLSWDNSDRSPQAANATNAAYRYYGSQGYVRQNFLFENLPNLGNAEANALVLAISFQNHSSANDGLRGSMTIHLERADEIDTGIHQPTV